MKKLAFVAAAVALFAALASPASAQSTQRVRRERNHIRLEEIQQSNATNAFDLIQGLRPIWLTRMHPTDLHGDHGEQILVYVDRAPLSSIEELRQVSLNGVQQIDFLSPGETEFRLGKYSPNGAIVIVTTAPAPNEAGSHP
jgi:hypothetical protein